MSEGLLLHVCCATCAICALERLRPLFSRVTCFFYNPNIHPQAEFQKRLRAVEVLAERLRDPSVDWIFEREYGLVPFLRAVVRREDDRCRICYSMRLGTAAKTAGRLGLPAFSTTLSTSPYQDHALLRRAGARAARLFGVKFVYDDLREFLPAAAAKAKKMSLYRQRYCGCVYSERRREVGAKKKRLS